MIDEIIEIYKRGVDVTLLEESLKRIPDERILALEKSECLREELRGRRRSGRVTRFVELLRTLAKGGVEFILIGGVAMAQRDPPRIWT